MSILKGPYELTVWEDVWDGAKFVERRLGVIGGSDMLTEGRAYDATLTRNVNGSKKLSFKLAKRYVDSVSGEEIVNPFCDWLVSERKVKLQYAGEWYDFVVKNIAEDSSSRINTYQLEDALVQELSKNGFNVELSDELMNNSGTAQELAEFVLKDTDWKVESEAFVEKIEEALIYLRTSYGFTATQVIDQTDSTLGEGVTEQSASIPSGAILLGFYSCCNNKPYRFQFIYVKDLDTLVADENRVITNANCQYYIECKDSQYYENKSGFWLPMGIDTTTVSEDNVSTMVSIAYRGERYGFSMKTVYNPVLERYLNCYNGGAQYGYADTEYCSPILT